MALISYKASAPGTLMLLGEHAVLQDKQALVFSIDKRITVEVTPRQDSKILLTSNLGQLELDLAEPIPVNPLTEAFRFIIEAIRQLKHALTSGFRLSVTSEFPSTIGLGSSAAVTVATVAALYKLIDPSIQFSEVSHSCAVRLQIFERAKEVIKTVQGVGSGADAAASVFGGVILYHQKPPYILKKINQLLPVVVVYSGYKTPTPTVIRLVQKNAERYPDIFRVLYSVIDQCVIQAVANIEANDWQSLGQILTIQQGIMQALGVSTPELNRLIDSLNTESTVFGAKISGSGLGDCVVAIGSSMQPSEAKSDLQGVRYG